MSDKTYWEQIAETKWGAYISDLERSAILKANELARNPGTALEVGAEGGRWSKLLADQGWNMICTDVDSKSLRVCKSKVPSAHCILVSSNDKTLPCVTESVELLVCIEVAPVIQSNWFVDEASRVLKSGGLLVAVCWNFNSWRGLFSHAKSVVMGTFSWYRCSYPIWRRRLLRSRFSIVSEQGCCWFPFRRDSNSPVIPFCVSLEKMSGLRNLTQISPWIVLIAKKS